MARKLIFTICLCLISLTLYGSEFKQQALIKPLENQNPETYFTLPGFSTAELCSVKHDAGVYWAIDHWVIGNELYKAYQDPAMNCTGPYPFTIEKLFIVLQVQTMCDLQVSIDVESVDNTNPLCPTPGNLLMISETYEINFPAGGLYQIEFPLDTPFVVTEPYFAGFYIGSYVDSTWGLALITDSMATTCANYNIWDTAVGYVDLGNNSYYNFPGRMVFFTAGTPGGGGGTQPAPSITILSPEHNENVTGELSIWTAETSGSNIINQVLFEYRSFGGWHEIGRDYDGSTAFRNGNITSGIGEGWSTNWDYSLLPEDIYWIKATVTDTLGRIAVDSIQVAVDPTPPDPEIVSPAMFSTTCHPIDIGIVTEDEDITSVKFEKKNATLNYSIPVTTYNQNAFNDYYCGPVAAAQAIKYWFDKGFVYGMREGSIYLPIDTVISRLGENMHTDIHNGTYDDLFYYGLKQYIITHGNELRLGLYRDPDYHQFRTLFQEQELLLILGLGGNPGVYLVATGVEGLDDGNGQYTIQLSDPTTGAIGDALLRNSSDGSEVYYRNSWHPLDILFTVKGHDHEISREYLGQDSDPSGGWNYDWTSSAMQADSIYFITVTANDATGRLELSQTTIIGGCSTAEVKGDYDGDGHTNVGDALYLVEFIYKNGPAPVNGAGRADANCDNSIDIGDAIYMIRYLFEGGQPPCY